MKLAKRTSAAIQEGDYTAMIDMVFQLICFFMVVINFSEGDQNEKIQLPASELARPPDGPLPFPITMHLTKEGNVVLGGDEVPISGLRPLLVRETAGLESQSKSPADATIIIRADGRTPTGKVQDLIKVCQENRYDRFALRVQEEAGH